MIEIRSRRKVFNLKRVRTWKGLRRRIFLPNVSTPWESRYQSMTKVTKEPNEPDDELQCLSAAQFENLLIVFYDVEIYQYEKRLNKKWWKEINTKDDPVQSVVYLSVYLPPALSDLCMTADLIIKENTGLWIWDADCFRRIEGHDTKGQKTVDIFEFFKKETKTENENSFDVVVPNFLPIRQGLQTLNNMLVKVAVHPERERIMSTYKRVWMRR